MQQEIEVECIKFSQSSVSKKMNFKVKKFVDSLFDINIYNQDPIRIVRFWENEYTSLDNRRLYWAKHNSIKKINCFVHQSLDVLHEITEINHIILWEEEEENGQKIIYQGLVMVLTYEAWIAFRCARQGCYFPIKGQMNLPSISSDPLCEYKIEMSSCTTNEIECDKFYNDLQLNSNKVYTGNDSSFPLLYYNESMQSFLKQNNIKTHLRVLWYKKIVHLRIKAMSENKDEWDSNDWDVYEQEKSRLENLDEVFQNHSTS